MSKILFAEDKKEVAELMIEILQHEGHDVTWAENGDVAIEKLKADPAYRLLITDVLMPDKDGFDVVNYMKENNIDIPIIVMSGGGVTLSAGRALEAIKEDADIVLRKPVNIQDLKDAITSLT